MRRETLENVLGNFFGICNPDSVVVMLERTMLEKNDTIIRRYVVIKPHKYLQEDELIFEEELIGAFIEKNIKGKAFFFKCP